MNPAELIRTLSPLLGRAGRRVRRDRGFKRFALWTRAAARNVVLFALFAVMLFMLAWWGSSMRALMAMPGRLSLQSVVATLTPDRLKVQLARKDLGQPPGPGSADMARAPSGGGSSPDRARARGRYRHPRRRKRLLGRHASPDRPRRRPAVARAEDHSAPGRLFPRAL